MSVVFATYRFDDRRPMRDEIAACVEVSRDAAPDGDGVWVSGRVGLGHGLLVRVPGVGRAEPRALAERLVVVADARIDNRAELAAELGEPEAAADDATCILHAYRRWGMDALPRLEGDFAFVLWDGAAGRLVAVRDYFGMRPLFVHTDPTRVVFGSELRQLHRDPATPRTLDEDAVSDFLHTARRGDPAASFFRGVAMVRPGHAVVVTRAGVEETRYWWWHEPDPLRYPRRSDYAEHLAEVFGRAVAVRVPEGRPFGLFLSGGLDSGSIAGMAAKVLRDRGDDASLLRTYSMVYDDHPSCDERTYIEPLVARLGCDAHFLHPERQSLFADRSLAEVDEPDAVTIAEPQWRDALVDLVAAGGRVMLGGDAGETVMLSQSNWHFVDWLVGGRLRTLLRELRAYRKQWGQWPEISLRGLAAVRIPGWLSRRLPVAWSSSRPDWLDSSVGAWRRRVLRARSRRPARVLSSYAREIAYQRTSAPDGQAPGWWTSGAHGANRFGVVYNYPFMDRRLQQFLWAVPLEQFFDAGRDRAVLRDAIEGLVTDAVRERLVQTVFDDWLGRVAGGPELRRVLEVTPWPPLACLPSRNAALAAAQQGEASSWELIALAQFVVWYDSRRDWMETSQCR